MTEKGPSALDDKTTVPLPWVVAIGMGVVAVMVYVAPLRDIANIDKRLVDVELWQKNASLLAPRVQNLETSVANLSGKMDSTSQAVVRIEEKTNYIADELKRKR